MSFRPSKNIGKFSSTLRLAPPKVKPHCFSFFLKNVCKKIIEKTAVPISSMGEA